MPKDPTGQCSLRLAISEAFFEKNPARIVRQAAQLIDPRSNYRKALDFVLTSYEQGKPGQQIAATSEARWRPEYPQLNNSVANGALVALGILFGAGDYLKSINIVTRTGDFTNAGYRPATHRARSVCRAQSRLPRSFHYQTPRSRNLLPLRAEFEVLRQDPVRKNS